MNSTRDDLTMKLLGMRQLVRDAPEQNLPEIARLTEQYLAELSR